MENVGFTPAHKKPGAFLDRFDRRAGDPRQTHYCPGCGHGVVSKLIAEAIDDLGIQDRAVLISPVGCAVFSYAYFDVGNVAASHGRAPAVATGIKRARPESIVISYQGDGDLAAIGSAEILHAANRGENITVIFVNNAIYGMTGGQMAPTTVLTQRTTTTPEGRTATEGFPLKVCELLSTLEAPAYIERVALADNRSLMKARRAIRKAIQNQIEGKGFSFVEVLSPCPVQWELSPVDALHWIQEKMIPTFPLGVFRERGGANPTQPSHSVHPSIEEIPRILGIRDTAEVALFPTPFPAAQPYSNPRIIVSGFGGQGGLFLGELLAESAMRHGYQVSWLPSYGPEMRGGTAHCHVIISSEMVHSPLVDHPTVLIALNEPSLVRFGPQVVAGGLLIYDSSLIANASPRSDLEKIAIPATAMAEKLGNSRVANMVILGAYLARTNMVSRESLAQALSERITDGSIRECNLKAVDAGWNFAAARDGKEAL
jgi:2-oxoisovalerate ferredoxin oxidoreductase beta subunit